MEDREICRPPPIVSEIVREMGVEITLDAFANAKNARFPRHWGPGGEKRMLLQKIGRKVVACGATDPFRNSLKYYRKFATNRQKLF